MIENNQLECKLLKQLNIIYFQLIIILTYSSLIVVDMFNSQTYI